MSSSSPNRLLAGSIVVLSLFTGAPHLAASDRWETLQAINWVENPTNSDRAGSKGELGPYQFRRSTWEMHTKKPFRYALRRKEADEVAVRHYEWLKQGLIRNGLSPTPYNIAAAWNAGLSAVVKGRTPAVTQDYAQRVTNLVEMLNRRQQVSSASPRMER